MCYEYHSGILVISYHKWNLETKYKDKVNTEKVDCKT